LAEFFVLNIIEFYKFLEIIQAANQLEVVAESHDIRLKLQLWIPKQNQHIQPQKQLLYKFLRVPRHQKKKGCSH